MKNNKYNFKGMDKDELKKKLSHLDEELRVLRFKSEGSKSKNVKESGTLRKQIARVMTEINYEKHAKRK